MNTRAPLLPPNDPQRELLHNEVHARPSARIRMPALVVYVAVLNEGITREMEWQHLRQLPGQEGLTLEHLSGNFQRLRFANHTLTVGVINHQHQVMRAADRVDLI